MGQSSTRNSANASAVDSRWHPDFSREIHNLKTQVDSEKAAVDVQIGGVRSLQTLALAALRSATLLRIGVIAAGTILYFRTMEKSVAEATDDPSGMDASDFTAGASSSRATAMSSLRIIALGIEIVCLFGVPKTVAAWFASANAVASSNGTATNDRDTPALFSRSPRPFLARLHTTSVFLIQPFLLLVEPAIFSFAATTSRWWSFLGTALSIVPYTLHLIFVRIGYNFIVSRVVVPVVLLIPNVILSLLGGLINVEVGTVGDLAVRMVGFLLESGEPMGTTEGSNVTSFSEATTTTTTTSHSEHVGICLYVALSLVYVVSTITMCTAAYTLGGGTARFGKRNHAPTLPVTRETDSANTVGEDGGPLPSSTNPPHDSFATIDDHNYARCLDADGNHRASFGANFSRHIPDVQNESKLVRLFSVLGLGTACDLVDYWCLLLWSLARRSETVRGVPGHTTQGRNASGGRRNFVRDILLGKWMGISFSDRILFSEDADEEAHTTDYESLLNATMHAASLATATSTDGNGDSSSASVSNRSAALTSPLLLKLGNAKSVPISATTSASAAAASDPIDLSCVVCLENRPDVLFIPCGHISCCVDCVRKLASERQRKQQASNTPSATAPKEECPICKAKIDDVFYPAIW